MLQWFLDWPELYTLFDSLKNAVILMLSVANVSYFNVKRFPIVCIASSAVLCVIQWDKLIALFVRWRPNPSAWCNIDLFLFVTGFCNVLLVDMLWSWLSWLAFGMAHDSPVVSFKSCWAPFVASVWRHPDKWWTLQTVRQLWSFFFYLLKLKLEIASCVQMLVNPFFFFFFVCHNLRGSDVCSVNVHRPSVLSPSWQVVSEYCWIDYSIILTLSNHHWREK